MCAPVRVCCPRLGSLGLRLSSLPPAIDLGWTPSCNWLALAYTCGDKAGEQHTSEHHLTSTQQADDSRRQGRIHCLDLPKHCCIGVRRVALQDPVHDEAMVLHVHRVGREVGCAEGQALLVVVGVLEQGPTGGDDKHAAVAELCPVDVLAQGPEGVL
eukprot:14142330-Alexandrium_andersonii.AAC.1